MTENTVSVKVDDEQLDEWEEAVEENEEYSSKSQLVRLSVTKELNGDHETHRPEEITEKLERVVNSIDGLSESLNHIETRVSRIEQSVSPDKELTELKNEIYGELHAFEDEEKAIHRLAVQDRGFNGTVDELADRSDRDVEDVVEAIQELNSETARVRTFEADGKTRYWKEV